MTLDDDLQIELAALSARARLRQTRALAGPDRVHQTTEDGRPILSFCSNDYLGLAADPALCRSAAAEISTSGVGSGAARLISGESPAHQALEATLARFLDRPAALTFPTGYLANVGVITALATSADLIASDAANHASIIDGCRLSRARVLIYPHLSVPEAATALSSPGAYRRRFLVTESLFSMDGDRAPLGVLENLALLHGATLIVDEAHALGATGPGGRGLCAAAGVQPGVLVGTLGKAFGTMGGFVAGSEILRRTLVNRARTFIYSTGAPAAIARAAATAILFAASPDGDARRAHALELASRLRDGLASLGLRHTGRDLIIPVLLGPDALAVQVSDSLLEQGVFVPSIRPPTVPEGSARLRMTVSALHSRADIDRLLHALSTCVPARARASAPA